jgi:hypothetical protein
VVTAGNDNVLVGIDERPELFITGSLNDVQSQIKKPILVIMDSLQDFTSAGISFSTVGSEVSSDYVAIQCSIVSGAVAPTKS